MHVLSCIVYGGRDFEKNRGPAQPSQPQTPSCPALALNKLRAAAALGFFPSAIVIVPSSCRPPPPLPPSPSPFLLPLRPFASPPNTCHCTAPNLPLFCNCKITKSPYRVPGMVRGGPFWPKSSVVLAGPQRQLPFSRSFFFLRPVRLSGGVFTS